MSLYAIFSIINAVVALLLGLFLFYRARHLVSYLLFNLSLVIYNIFYAIWMILDTGKLVELSIHLVIASVWSISFLFLNLSYNLTKTKRSQPIYFLNLFLLIVATGASFSKYVIGSIEPILSFSYWPKAGPTMSILMLYFSVNMFRAFQLLLNNYKYDKKLKYIIIGMALGFFGGISNFLLCYDILFPPIFNGLIAIHAFLTAFGIAKKELLDIRTSITKATTYLIIGAAVIFSWAFILLLLEEPSWMLVGKVSLFSALTATWIFVFPHIRKLIQTPFHNKWVSLFYNSDLLIRNITEELAKIDRRIDSVGDTICGYLENTLKTQNARFVKYDALDQYVTNANYFKSHRKVLTNKNAVAQLSNEEKSAAIIPIFSSAQFEGAIILGSKESEDSYTEKDLNVFRIVQNQALIAIDRIRKHEEVIQANTALTAMNQNLEKLVEEKVAEAETAKEYAQKVSQQAAFGTLTKGIAHELRNPLGMIMGLSEGLQRKIKKDADKDKLIELASDITKGADRLTQILDSMLQFGEGTSKGKFKEFPINAAIAHAENLIKAECNEKGIQLNLDCSKNTTIIGDEGLISQVIFNLILNGIQAIEAKGEKNGQIDVVCQEADGKIMISVSDNGLGISDDEKAKIFDAFHTTKYESTGLGLSLSLQIMEQHGGKIQFESEEGKGSTFRLVLAMASSISGRIIL